MVEFFIPTEHLNIPQSLFLVGIYGCILIMASTYLGEGAEILLEALGPAWAGVIGGILIPILGILPDSLMVLMSGMGPADKVVEEVAIGAGTLIGSTCMLLTIPTALGIFFSRRKLGGREMRALKVDKERQREVFDPITGQLETKTITVSYPVVPKSTSPFDLKTWTQVGGTALSTTPKGAKIAMLTSLTYLIIEIPALLWSRDKDHGVKHEHWPALVAFCVSIAVFIWYVYYVYTDNDALEVIAEKQRELSAKLNLTNALRNIQTVIKSSTTDPFTQSEALFELFDSNNSGTIDFEEMQIGWKSIGYDLNEDQARQSFNMLDSDKNGSINRKEFYSWIEDYLLNQYIAAQPLPQCNLGQNPSLDDILTEFPFPSTVKSETVVKIKSFLMHAMDSNENRLSFVSDKDERYALAVWFSTVQGFPDGMSFATHCEDTIDVVPTGTGNFASTTDLLGVAKKQNKTITSHFDRTFHVEKITDKSAKSSMSQMRPHLRPLLSGVPAWACASHALTTWFKSNNLDNRSAWRQIFNKVKNIKNNLDLEGFQAFAKDYTLQLTPTQVKFLFYSHDTDTDHQLSEEQFKMLLQSLVATDDTQSAVVNVSSTIQQSGSGSDLKEPLLDQEKSEGDEEEEDQDDDEEGSEHAHLTRGQLIRTAVIYILGGALVVTAFSDPTVEAIGHLGDLLKIPPFYLAFTLVPLFSNSSEILASLKFAMKKTDVSLGLTLSSLYGAAAMNNSALLATFLGLIYFRQIPWTATNEVLVMLVLTWTVGWLGMKQTLPLWRAAVMFMLFPLSIGAIYLLNAHVKW